MLCPDLDALPSPGGRTGWPWTEASQPAPAADWPRISVVTPSFNQGQYLEETIRSVLLQGYPDLEYYVIDGASSDHSVDIIRKYERWLSGWRSEPDSGQVEAIEKGLARSTGELFNWINSDDVLAPGALFEVADGLSTGGGASDCGDAFAGSCRNWSEDDRGITIEHVLANQRLSALNLIRGTAGAIFQQPAFWVRRRRLLDCGGLDRRLHHAFDMEMAVRYLARNPRVRYTDRILANFRMHPGSKTVAESGRFLADYHTWLRWRSDDPHFPTLQRPCLRRLDELARHREVALLLSDRTRSIPRRALPLIRQSLRWTRPSLARISAAALWRLLRGLPWFLPPTAWFDADIRSSGAAAKSATTAASSTDAATDDREDPR